MTDPPSPADDPPVQTGDRIARGLVDTATRLGGYAVAAGIVAFVYLLIGSIPGWRLAGWAAIAWAFLASAALSMRFLDIRWVGVVVAAFAAIEAAPPWLVPEAPLPGTFWEGSAETPGWMLGAMAAGFGSLWVGSMYASLRRAWARLRGH